MYTSILTVSHTYVLLESKININFRKKQKPPAKKTRETPQIKKPVCHISNFSCTIKQIKTKIPLTKNKILYLHACNSSSSSSPREYCFS